MSDPSLESIKEAAARWVHRMDSGLSDLEEQEFEAWLEADPRHSDVLAEHQALWKRLGTLSAAAEGTQPNRNRYAYSRRPASVLHFITPLVAAAAAVAFGFFVWQSQQVAPAPAALPLPARVVQQTLPDGSIVELNRGAEISVNYTATERRVALLRGEASFEVAKNKDVPFIVAAGGAEFRAVGTAFNVRYDSNKIELTVTEGRVQVATPTALAAGPSAAPFPILEVGETTTVSLTAPVVVPQIAKLTAAEMDTRLAWQPRLLDFDDAPLATIVEVFNERNPVRLVIRDPSLATLRLNASFRSDNMEGFVRLLESNYGLRAEAISATEIALARAR